MIPAEPAVVEVSGFRQHGQVVDSVARVLVEQVREHVVLEVQPRLNHLPQTVLRLDRRAAADLAAVILAQLALCAN